jgi:hypothetical protein
VTSSRKYTLRTKIMYKVDMVAQDTDIRQQATGTSGSSSSPQENETWTDEDWLHEFHQDIFSDVCMRNLQLPQQASNFEFSWDPAGNIDVTLRNLTTGLDEYRTIRFTDAVNEWYVAYGARYTADQIGEEFASGYQQLFDGFCLPDSCQGCGYCHYAEAPCVQGCQERPWNWDEPLDRWAHEFMHNVMPAPASA